MTARVHRGRRLKTRKASILEGLSLKRDCKGSLVNGLRSNKEQHCPNVENTALVDLPHRCRPFNHAHHIVGAASGGGGMSSEECDHHRGRNIRSCCRSKNRNFSTGLLQGNASSMQDHDGGVCVLIPHHVLTCRCIAAPGNERCFDGNLPTLAVRRRSCAGMH